VSGARYNDAGQLLASDGLEFHCQPGSVLSGHLVLNGKPDEGQQAHPRAEYVRTTVSSPL
jgi:hypothetical protein